MNSHLMAHAATIAVKSAASQSGAELPAQSRALHTADFERLMAQAQEQQAQVQLTNPVSELGQQGVGRISKDIGEASQHVRTTMETSRQAIASLDPKDPASLAKFVGHIEDQMAAVGQFSIMLNEVTLARKSLGELFHNQG